MANVFNSFFVNVSTQEFSKIARTKSPPHYRKEKNSLKLFGFRQKTPNHALISITEPIRNAIDNGNLGHRVF